MRNQFGERLFSIFFKTYTEKVWGMGCDEISADWAAQRIKGLNLGAAVIDGLRRSLGVKKKGEGAKSLIESFRYPRKGPGMMWEAAAEKIVGFGGRVQMGRSVEHLAYDEASKIWTVSVRRADGVLEQYAARNVISSAPINELMSSITPTPLSLLHARDLKPFPSPRGIPTKHARSASSARRSPCPCRRICSARRRATITTRSTWSISGATVFTRGSAAANGRACG